MMLEELKERVCTANLALVRHGLVVLARRRVLCAIASVVVLGCCATADAAGRPECGCFLEGLLAIPSVSSDMDANNEAVRYVKGWLDARGVCTSVVTNEAGRAALYASTTSGREHDVVFVTHLDVVPPLAEGQFEPRIEGDRIYGRGACDTKGNVAVIAQVLANLAGTCSVGAVFATDEEYRTPGTATPVALLEAGFTPKKFIIVGDTNGEFVDSLSYAEKGHFVMKVVARGKGGHSSMPWRADNPVPKLMRAMAKIMELYPAPEADEDHWRDHVTPTRLVGAPAGNIIPDVAEMSFSCRVVSPDSAARIKAQVEEATGLEVVVPESYRLPVLTDPENGYVKSLFAAMRAKWPEKDIRLTRMSCATDATRYVHLNLPTVIFGATGGGTHAAVEWVSLKSVEDYAAMFTEYLRASKE